MVRIPLVEQAIPGGQFRVGVPDTEWPLTAYVKEDHSYFQFVRENWHPAYYDTQMHNLNYHFRQGSEHKYAYDYETLEQLLARTVANLIPGSIRNAGKSARCT